MTNEWGAPIPGDEMKALKGRIDPETSVVIQGGRYRFRSVLLLDGGRYFLPANHPYYKVREHNAKHGTNLVLHDGNAKVPDDADPNGKVLVNWGGGELELLPFDYIGEWGLDPDGAGMNWGEVIAYTPKPKESEVTEQMPSDEAIEYVLREYFNNTPEYAKSVVERNGYSKAAVALAELIQQYEPDRLKPAVDIAAEKYVGSRGFDEDNPWTPEMEKCFKAGAAWQKENGNG